MGRSQYAQVGFVDRRNNKFQGGLQSVSSHWPFFLTIGFVRRASEFRASYEKRSLSESQHSLMASFSSGRTRITLFCLTWTTRLEPRPSCGDTDLRRDSSQVLAL